MILLGDYNIAESIEKCVRVLITATQHKLYQDLNSRSTAPLWRNEPVSEVSIRPLIISCLQVLEPWSRVIPSVKPRVSSARLCRERLLLSLFLTMASTIV